MSARTSFGRATAVLRRRARPDLVAQQDRSGHGERRTYVYWLCRCPRCRRANNRYSNTRRMEK